MNEQKKYKLTDEKIEVCGRTLYRIEALIDIPEAGVKKGDKGGYVQQELNLNTQVSDKAWVFDEARVFGEARVSGEAQVFDKARVFDKAWVFGEARVSGKAWVFGEARVSGEAWVSGEARVSGEAQVSDKARVSGKAWVFGEAQVFDEAQVFGEARVKLTIDLIVVSPIGSRQAPITYVFPTDTVCVGGNCWNGTLAKFKKRVSDVHGDNQWGKEYAAYIEFIKAMKKIRGREE